jgi:hypothetical protein
LLCLNVSLKVHGRNFILKFICLWNLEAGPLEGN